MTVIFTEKAADTRSGSAGKPGRNFKSHAMMLKRFPKEP
jgi:hypothetical protein